MMHHSSTPMPRLPPSFTASPTTSATSAPTPTGPAAAPGSGSAGVSSGTLTSDGRIHNSPPSFFPHVPLTQSLNHPGTAGPPGPPGTAPGPGLGLFHSPGSGFGGPSTARRDTLPNPSLSRSPSDSASAAGASGSGTGPGTGTLRREISDFSLLPGPGPIPGSMHAPSMIQDQRKRMSLPGDLLNPLPGAAPPSTADTGPFWEHETGQNGEASGSGSSAGHAGAGSQGRKGRQMDVDMEEEEEEDGKKRKNSATGLNAGLTSSWSVPTPFLWEPKPFRQVGKADDQAARLAGKVNADASHHHSFPLLTLTQPSCPVHDAAVSRSSVSGSRCRGGKDPLLSTCPQYQTRYMVSQPQGQPLRGPVPARWSPWTRQRREYLARAGTHLQI